MKPAPGGVTIDADEVLKELAEQLKDGDAELATDLEQLSRRVPSNLELAVGHSPDVRMYLDDAITKWRAVRDAREPVPDGLLELATRIEDNPGSPDVSARELAALYVDAFQSTRVTLLGELLP
jgi:hypothetical protein